MPAGPYSNESRVCAFFTLLSDKEIIEQFASASTKHSAFTLLVEKYQERLYWHIRRVVGQHEDANDVIQNTFVKVWKGLAKFRGDSQLYSWLYRIASNECFTHLEKKKKRGLVSGTVDGPLPIDQLISDPYFNEEAAQAKLEMAISQLPAKQREVFSLRYFQEISYEEMSKSLDTSVGALKASYHHAAKKVEAYLKDA